MIQHFFKGQKLEIRNSRLKVIVKVTLKNQRYIHLVKLMVKLRLSESENYKVKDQS